MKTYARKGLLGRAVGGGLEAGQRDDAAGVALPKQKITDYFFKKIDLYGEPHGTEDAAKARPISSGHAAKSEAGSGRQTGLDFGQRRIIECSTCGLCYDRTVDGDVKRHAKEHQRMAAKTTLMADKICKAAMWRQSFSDDPQLVLVRFLLGRIPPAAVDFARCINGEMSALEQSAEDLARGKFEFYFLLQRQTLNGSQRTEIVSFALIEKIDSCHRVCLFQADPAVGRPQQSDARAGVSRIWTGPSCRGKGLAKRLLAEVRCCEHTRADFCLQTCRLRADQIAFSQPTAEGRLLAQRFLNQQDAYLVYMEAFRE